MPRIAVAIMIRACSLLVYQSKLRREHDVVSATIKLLMFATVLFCAVGTIATLSHADFDFDFKCLCLCAQWPLTSNAALAIVEERYRVR